jgi:hypothetical protein
VFTNDMTGGVSGSQTGTIQLYNPNPSQTQPNYTRNGVTQYFYTWDTSGRILAIGSDAAGKLVPNCIPK